VTAANTDHQLIADETASNSWRDAVAALRSYVERRGTAEVPVRARARGLNLGKWTARCRDDYWHGVLSLEHTRQLEAVDTWQWGPDRSGTWRHAFNAVARYAAERGTTVFAEETTFDRVDLQAWAAAQRAAYAAGCLPIAAVGLLEQLPGWQWDVDIARWAQGLAVARLYIERHGGLEAVTRETRIGAFRLGHWIQRCREDYRGGTMRPERSAELEALQGWSWRQPQLQSWTDGLQALRDFISQSGHASPSQHEVMDGFPIGWWVTKRRRDYRLGTLSQAHAADLEALPGWQWDPLEHRWQRGFSALAAYAAAHGHANPTRGRRFNGYPVGDWVRAQRTARENHRLSAARAALLEALPGWCWTSSPGNRS
jgi:hypothetical protein